MKIDTNMTIGELMTDYPQAARLLMEKKMLCIGCPAEAFHTLRDAARLYGLDEKEFLSSLRRVVRTGE